MHADSALTYNSNCKIWSKYINLTQNSTLQSDWTPSKQSNNLPSSFQHPSTLDDNIIAERNMGCIIGPFQTPPLLNFCCSRLGLVPKHDGGWHAIYHLSAPYGSSISDSIDPLAYTLSHCSVDDAFANVSAVGKGTLIAKIDLKNAFRLIPVPPEDWNLLGIQWRNQFYINTCLPVQSISWCHSANWLNSPLPVQSSWCHSLVPATQPWGTPCTSLFRCFFRCWFTGINEMLK